FEEAHNLFAANDDDERTKIYRRLAKEGAKYQIGMVYSTQSVTSVSKDLLGQTENFFIAHLASQDEVNALARVNVTYESMKDDIMLTKTPLSQWTPRGSFYFAYRSVAKVFGFFVRH